MNASLRTLMLIACTVLPLSAAAAPSAASIPAAAFFKRSETTGAILSPNGRFVALRRLSPEGRTMLVIMDVADRKLKAVANFNNADIDAFGWLSDRRLAFTVVNVQHGSSTGKTVLYAIDRDGQHRTALSETIVRKPSFAESDAPIRHEQTQMLYRGFPFSKDEDMVVVEVTGDEKELKRLNTRTGRLSAIRAPNNTFAWLVDPDGDTRIAVARRSGRVNTLFYDKDEWRQIDSVDEKAEPNIDPLLYVDGNLYVSSRNGKDEASLYRYDLAANAILPKPLISAPGFDTDGQFVVSDRKMLGFRFNTDAEITVWFDPQMKAIQQEVDQLLPGRINRVSRGRSSETPYVLVDTTADIQNHSYLLYNTETKQRILLGEETPDVPVEKMARMSMVRYPARDGAQIPAFLSLPNGAAQTRLPTVVLLGAKPEQRSGVWQWHAEVQFLASRGYAVLQPEPRGVRGFGRAHFLSGSQQPELALKDIADAVQWAVANGHTDPARVCVAGTGHGGYRAMMALLKHPGIFACGISWSGMTAYQNNPDDSKLTEIRQPVLLAYGTEDEEVKYGEGLAFYKALKARNPQAEWLEYAPSTDDWKTQKNRIGLWQQIENFLGRRIGAQ